MGDAFFLNGAALPDPGQLLEGQGKQVRSIRLLEASRLDAPEVRALVLEATRPYEEALRPCSASSPR